MNGDDQIAVVKLMVAGADYLAQHGATQENKLIGAVNDLIAQANRNWTIVGAGEGAEVKVDQGNVVIDLKMSGGQATYPLALMAGGAPFVIDVYYKP